MHLLKHCCHRLALLLGAAWGLLDVRGKVVVDIEVQVRNIEIARQKHRLGLLQLVEVPPQRHVPSIDTITVAPTQNDNALRMNVQPHSRTAENAHYPALT